MSQVVSKSRFHSKHLVGLFVDYTVNIAVLSEHVLEGCVECICLAASSLVGRSVGLSVCLSPVIKLNVCSQVMPIRPGHYNPVI